MRLDDKITNPGELRTQITLLQSAVVKVPGGQTITWTPQATVYSKWVNPHGSEVTAGESLAATLPATVTIRYYSGLDTTWALLKGSDRYQILSVDNIRERNEYMEIKAQLTKGSV